MDKASGLFAISGKGSFEVLGKAEEEMLDVLIYIKAFNGFSYGGDELPLVKLNIESAAKSNKIKF